MTKKVIIFGAGYHGRNALRSCKKKNMRVLFFVDNAKKLISKKILGKKVYNPKILKTSNFDSIIVSGRYINQIFKQLKEFNISKKKILFWGKKELKLPKNLLEKRAKEVYFGLKIISDYLKNHKIKFWLDLGSLLFISRNQSLALTSDIDLLVEFKDYRRLQKICQKICFENRYFKISKKKVYKSKILKKEKITQLTIIISKKNNFDYEPAIFEFNLLVSKKNKFENLAKRRIYKTNYWQSQEFIDHKKFIYPVPIKRNDYLKTLYGSNWRAEKNFFLN